MMLQSWEEQLNDSKKTALTQDGKRKVHYLFTDGRELAEEYDLGTDQLLVRKWKRKSRLGAVGPWEVEVGEPQPSNVDPQLLHENWANPIFIRTDTKTSFQWKVRNLPYPEEVYSLAVVPEERCCVIRTSNKKYYKKFPIPDLDRCQIPLESSSLSFTHTSNTLIISYKKPKSILEFEKDLMRNLKKLKSINDGNNDCKTQ